MAAPPHSLRVHLKVELPRDERCKTGHHSLPRPPASDIHIAVVAHQCAAYSPLPSTTCWDRLGLRHTSATTPAATSTARSGWIAPTLSPDSGTNGRSPEVVDCLPHGAAGFSTSALAGIWASRSFAARPTPYASDPVLVHRLVRLLHASFRPRLTARSLRFATTSPPSGYRGDLHPRAVEHARHTESPARARSAGAAFAFRG
jgi:hypothetical protein